MEVENYRFPVHIMYYFLPLGWAAWNPDAMYAPTIVGLQATPKPLHRIAPEMQIILPQANTSVYPWYTLKPSKD